MLKKLFHIYFLIFIFCMMNRECTPLGIDMRYLCLFLGILLFFIGLFTKRKIRFNTRTKLIYVFYLFIFLSNFAWFFNNLEINKESFCIIFISFVFNFFSYILFVMYTDYVEYKTFYKCLLFSLGVLCASMLYCIFVGDLPLFISEYSGRMIDISKNFFGGEYRIAGFAQDPNYASLFLIIGILVNIHHYKTSKNIIGLMMIPIYMILYCYSASKTIFMALALMIIYSFMPKKIKPFFEKLLLFLIFAIPIFLIFLDIPMFQNDISMSQRLVYWQNAKVLFLKKPIIGSGLTAVRTFFQVNVPLGWYVQCHSTIFQILAENGIITFLLFIAINYENLRTKNLHTKMMIFVYLIFMINTETLYHIFSIFYLGILPILNEKEEKFENEKECNYISSEFLM